MRAGRDQALAGAGRGAEDDVRAGDDLDQRLLLRRVEAQALLLGPGRRTPRTARRRRRDRRGGGRGGTSSPPSSPTARRSPNRSPATPQDRSRPGRCSRERLPGRPPTCAGERVEPSDRHDDRGSSRRADRRPAGLGPPRSVGRRRHRAPAPGLGQRLRAAAPAPAHGRGDDHRPALPRGPSGRAAAPTRSRTPSATARDADLAAWLATAGSPGPGQPRQRLRPLGPAGRRPCPDVRRPARRPPTSDRRPHAPTPPPVRRPTPTPSGPTADFTISSFNVLGSSHTRGGARGKQSGVVRMAGAVDLLAQHDVDVVGFQELQSDQLRELQRLSTAATTSTPAPRLTSREAENSVGLALVGVGAGPPRDVLDPLLRRQPPPRCRWSCCGTGDRPRRRTSRTSTTRPTPGSYHGQQRWRDQATARRGRAGQPAHRHRHPGVPHRRHERAGQLLLRADGRDLDGRGPRRQQRPRRVRRREPARRRLGLRVRRASRSPPTTRTAARSWTGPPTTRWSRPARASTRAPSPPPRPADPAGDAWQGGRHAVRHRRRRAVPAASRSTASASG